MPFYKKVLLLGWPSHIIFKVGILPLKVDPTILGSMARTNISFYTKNPKTKCRNQVKDTQSANKINNSFTALKFLSKKARTAQSTNKSKAKTIKTIKTLTDLYLNNITRKDVPTIYGNVEIKYSKFNINNFNFA